MCAFHRWPHKGRTTRHQHFHLCWCRVNVYLLASVVILLANIAPVALIAVGVVSAVIGRAVLALIFRRLRPWLPTRYLANLEAAGIAITKTRSRSIAALLLFLISPLSSAQLFEAAGLMKKLRLWPILIAFGVGRIISYSVYVSGAHALKETSLGALVQKYLTSPQAIAIDLALVVGLVALGSIDWTRPIGWSKRSVKK